MADRDAIERELRALLDPDAFSDHAPNGLQVEGRREVGRASCRERVFRTV